MIRNDSPRDALSGMLQEVRFEEPLPLRFADAVWQRIQRAEATAKAAPAWLVRLANLVLRPQWAVAGLAAMMVLGATLGTLQGQQSAKELALARYVASVAPDIVR